MADWGTQCLDWESRIMSGRSLVPRLPLFREQEERALRIFRRLKVPDMQGRPTIGDVAGEWLFPIVGAIFGSYDVETDRRMLSEFFWLVPKKNGKTSSAAAIMVTALILNRRPEGEYVLIAPTKEIADISFSQAAGTIRADPALEKLFQTQTHIRRIQHRRTGAELKIKAADTDVITGGKQVGTLIDELHVLSAKREAASLLVEIRGALAARPDGFLITVTTQSKAPPSGVFKTELAKARDVRDGKLSLPLLPILYELPAALADNGGWKEPSTWRLVNPNLGRSVDEGFLARELAAAEHEGIAQLALFASQHFNVQIGQSLRADRWVGADFWEGAVDPDIDLDAILERCEVVVVGIDGGGLDDLFGLYVLGRERGTKRWLGWSHSWCHASVLDRRKSEAARLRDFERTGDLTIVETLGDDLVGIVDIVKRIDDAGLLASVGLDPVGVGAVVDALSDAGISGEGRIVGVSQGYKLMGAIKTAERKLVDGTLVPAAQPIMAWAVGNAKNEPRGNAMMITKQASGTAKIDPLMAAFDAVALMSMNPEAQNAGMDDFLRESLVA
jgi:phage terminase large subunit-like protein